VSTVKTLIAPIAFGIFVGITTIQCHYSGNVRMILAIVAGVALWISMYFFPRPMHERRDK
jgi:hypothetical protein